MENELGAVLILMDINGTMITMRDIDTAAYYKTFEQLYGLKNVNVFQYYTPGGTHEDNVWATLRGMRSEGKIQITDAEIAAQIPKVSEVQTSNLEAEMNEHPEKIIVLPGIRELLTAFKEREAVLGVLTGHLRKTYALILEKAGIADYFNFTIGADESAERKGRMTAALHAAKTMFDWRTDGKAFFFDDSSASIPIAREVGITSIAVGTGDSTEAKLIAAGPEYYVANLSDTKQILRMVSGETRKKSTVR